MSIFLIRLTLPWTSHSAQPRPLREKFFHNVCTAEAKHLYGENIISKNVLVQEAVTDNSNQINLLLNTNDVSIVTVLTIS